MSVATIFRFAPSLRRLAFGFLSCSLIRSTVAKSSGKSCVDSDKGVCSKSLAMDVSLQARCFTLIELGGMGMVGVPKILGAETTNKAHELSDRNVEYR